MKFLFQTMNRFLLFLVAVFLISCTSEEGTKSNLQATATPQTSQMTPVTVNTQCFNFREKDFDGCIVLIEKDSIYLLFDQPSNRAVNLKIPFRSIQRITQGKQNKLRQESEIAMSPLAIHFNPAELAIEYTEFLIEYTNQYTEFAIEYADETGKDRVTAFVVRRDELQDSQVESELKKVNLLRFPAKP